MHNKIFTAIGLMSGTSMDGIDAAIVRTDGHRIFEKLHGTTKNYSDDFKSRLRAVITNYQNNNNYDIEQIENELTHLHYDAVRELLRINKIVASDIDVIGFHGHTIDHKPEQGITVQIGDGDLLAELSKINVVYNFRIFDVQNGGQGAPLVPIYHHAIMADEAGPVAVVNIGGIANVTWIGHSADELLAFDTGPGNAIIDDWIKLKTDGWFDEDGKIASRGKIDHNLLSNLVSHPYFKLTPPKSLDRNQIKTIDGNYNISVEDGAMTLAAFTANTIAMASKFFPQEVKKWFITGGGRHNPQIMQKLQEYIAAPVMKIDSLGINGDLLEAEAFAFLAVRNLLDLPISFKGTTGIRQPATGGVRSIVLR